MDNPRIFLPHVAIERGKKMHMCDQFEDASVVQTIARHHIYKDIYAHHWKDTPKPKRTQQ